MKSFILQVSSFVVASMQKKQADSIEGGGGLWALAAQPRIFAVVFGALAGSISPVQAETAANFRILPSAEAILQDHCISCHGEDSQKGDVRLDQLGSLPPGERLAMLNRMQEQVSLARGTIAYPRFARKARLHAGHTSRGKAADQAGAC